MMKPVHKYSISECIGSTVPIFLSSALLPLFNFSQWDNFFVLVLGESAAVGLDRKRPGSSTPLFAKNQKRESGRYGKIEKKWPF